MAATVLLASVYALAGGISLSLAIPPGYATPVWPPAGIALCILLLRGWRGLPAVWLGSFLVNGGVAWSRTGSIQWSALGLAAGIAFGAALQAGVGATVIRRRLGPSPALCEPVDILTFLVLAGPLHCVVNATWSVTWLAWNGVVNWTSFPSNWLTWWIGDTLGSILFAVLGLVYFGHPRETWKSRRTPIALPLLGLFAVLIGFFVAARIWERERLERELEFEARNAVESISRSFEFSAFGLVDWRDFLSDQLKPDPSEMEQKGQQLLKRHMAIRLLAFDPVILGSERDAYESEMRKKIGSHFQITETDDEGRFVPAGRREWYVVVQHAYPSGENGAVLGFDVSSEARRRSTLRRAARLNVPSATPPLRLVQRASEEASLIVYLPIYRDPRPPTAPEDRLVSVRAFAAAEFDVKAVAATATSHLKHDGITARILAEGMAGHSEAGLQQRSECVWTHAGPTLMLPVSLGGSRLMILFSASPDYAGFHPRWLVTASQFSGLALMILMSAMLLLVTGQKSLVEDVVARRTAELRRADSALQQACEQLEERVAARTAELRRSNDLLRAEFEERTRTHQILRAVVEGTDDSIFVKDREGRFLLMNSAALRTLGRSAEEIIGRTTAEVFDTELASRIRTRDLEVMTTGRSQTFEETLPLSGGVRTFQSTESPLRDSDGQIIGICGIARDVTSQKAAQIALHYREAHLRAILHTVADAIVTVDEQGRICSFNPAAERIFGYSTDEVIGRSITLLMPEPLQEEASAYVPRYVNTGDGRLIGHKREFIARRRDGTLFPIELTVSEMRDGEQLHFVGIARDITQRRQAELALRSSERKYRTLVETSQDLIWSVDVEGFWTFVNRTGALAIYGFEPHEMIGRPFTDFTVPDRSKPDRETHERIKAGNAVYHYETRHVRKDGSTVLLHFNAVPLRDDEGNIVGTTGIARDVTEQKRAEYALRESENRFRTIFDTEPSCVKLISTDGVLQEINASGVRMVEAESADDLVGRPIVSLVLPEYRERYQAALRLAAEGRVGTLVFELEGLRGTRRWVDMQVSPMTGPDGRVQALLSVTRDITDRHCAEETLAQQKAELLHVSRLSTIGQMAAAISHEIAQPLNSVANFSSACSTLLSSNSAVDSSVVRQYVDEISRQSLRAGAILQRLRDFSRKSPARLAPCDLNAALRDSFELIADDLRRREVRLQWELDESLPLVTGDRIQLQQVIINLLNNASDSLQGVDPAGRIVTVRTIEVNNQISSGFVILEVEDRGLGIAPEIAGRLFQPFATNKPTGMGMGLSICRTIVSDHGGQIECRPNAFGGATFTVRLPIHGASHEP